MPCTPPDYAVYSAVYIKFWEFDENKQYPCHQEFKMAVGKTNMEKV